MKGVLDTELVEFTYFTEAECELDQPQKLSVTCAVSEV